MFSVRNGLRMRSRDAVPRVGSSSTGTCVPAFEYKLFNPDSISVVAKTAAGSEIRTKLCIQIKKCEGEILTPSFLQMFQSLWLSYKELYIKNIQFKGSFLCYVSAGASDLLCITSNIRTIPMIVAVNV
jgi:hypothetical protein